MLEKLEEITCFNNKNWKFPALVFIISFAYYCILSAKQFTWLFASGDSGDWLAASNLWIVPQPYGSPLYITLGHLVDLLPGSLPINMTVLLSCLPAAVTVTLVFLIVKHLTSKTTIALTAATIILGASIFLTQATVLEEYSIAVMFVVLAYLFYLKDKKKLTALSLGLGSAIHILVIPIAALWLFLEKKNWRAWAKTLPIYIASGILPYALIIYLMTTDAPRLLAGGLSLEAINSYLGSTSVFGSLSIFGLPERLLDFFSLIIMSFGLAVIPIWVALKRPWPTYIKLLVIGIAFPIWYYLTCLDPTSWTFMAYSCPFIAIAAGIGLAKVNKALIIKAVTISATALILLNSVFLNANLLAQKEPFAMDYYNELMSMPDGSAVVTHRGGFESMALFYVMSEGKDLIPIFFTDSRYISDALYQYYLEWIEKDYGIKGSNTQEQVFDVLGKGVEVYILIPVLGKWAGIYQTADCDLVHYDIVEGVDLTVEDSVK